MNMSLLDAASSYADSRDHIKLEAVYKAFQYGTGCREQAHLFKKNKIKLQEIRSVELNGSEKTWSERIFVTKTISASQEHDTPGSPNPYDRHNANLSVKRQSLPEHEKEGTDLLVVKPLTIGYKRQNERRKSSR